MRRLDEWRVCQGGNNMGVRYEGKMNICATSFRNCIIL